MFLLERFAMQMLPSSGVGAFFTVISGYRTFRSGRRRVGSACTGWKWLTPPSSHQASWTRCTTGRTAADPPTGENGRGDRAACRSSTCIRRPFRRRRRRKACACGGPSRSRTCEDGLFNTLKGFSCIFSITEPGRDARLCMTKENEKKQHDLPQKQPLSNSKVVNVKLYTRSWRCRFRSARPSGPYPPPCNLA